MHSIWHQYSLNNMTNSSGEDTVRQGKKFRKAMSKNVNTTLQICYMCITYQC